jgi:signal transduction histidine kinase/ActR/RegA family two-component response regulator
VLSMMEAIGSEIGLYIERKRTEIELSELNLELEKRVAERTSALERAHLALLQDVEERRRLEEQLRQAQRLESIGTLAGGIAHDFNNILNLIMGYTSLIQHSAGDASKLEQSVEIIKDTVKRGSSLVQQLLSIFRKTELSFEPVDINSFLEKLEVLLRETFPRTIEVSLELRPDLPAIMADANQLNQVMLNLCVNARDAMPNGGNLVLTTGVVASSQLRERFQEAKENDYAWIRVADTGFGMDEATRSRIFEPFFSTKEPGQGTGLGLAVVYGIIRSHSGFVDVESAPGRGAIFHVYFPIPAPPTGDIETAETMEDDDSEASGSTAGGQTILFVEDEPRQLTLMQTFLESEGYRVLSARDGAQAVDVFLRHKHEIAVVLLDIGLPKMNGWEAFLKMKEQSAELKAIFATGYISPEIEAGMASGEISGLIMKPYQLDDVLAKIAAALRQAAPVVPAGAAAGGTPPARRPAGRSGRARASAGRAGARGRGVRRSASRAVR